jgi:hypothetical protein
MNQDRRDGRIGSNDVEQFGTMGRAFEMEQPILRPLFELFFTAFPTGFFLQMLDGIAAWINFVFGIFGIQTNVAGF